MFFLSFLSKCLLNIILILIFVLKKVKIFLLNSSLDSFPVEGND